MTLCQYKCGTDLKPYDPNVKVTKNNPRYELDGTVHDYNRCVAIKSGFKKVAEDLDKEVSKNEANKEHQNYTNNDIMNELLNQKIQIAELITEFKDIKKDYGKAVAALSFDAAKNLVKKQ